ncbi:Protein TRANSPARENT TESTA 9 [Dionaea muscipula]
MSRTSKERCMYCRPILVEEIKEISAVERNQEESPNVILEIMWFSFWRSRNRFTLDELRYLTDQLQKVQIVNEINKDFVIEALRSIAELVTYGDQHDSAFFDFFMEKQVMGEFVRILKLSKIVSVPLQLLQTMSIMIQNLKNEHAIYYLFSNEHINYLITYSFDFRNEELLSYYMSFLRAISGKLDRSTISLLLKTENDNLVSFPLYFEAIRFAFHEESMIRTAVRALTLNVYHVGDESVNRYVTSGSLANYFRDLVSFFRKQCTDLSELVFQASTDLTEELSLGIAAAVDEIEDNLYYFSDVISAGIPDVDRLIMDNLLQLLILPLLLPSLTGETVNDIKIGAVTSLYLLCCILRIVKIKDLTNTIAAALFCPRVAFLAVSEVKVNGDIASSETHSLLTENETNRWSNGDFKNMKVAVTEDSSLPDGAGDSALREVLLSYVTTGSDVLVLGSLIVLATLLQTKELDESMLDALGILPQRKQHKKLLLQALVGESSGEEQLFSSGSSSARESLGSVLDNYLHKLREQYGISLSIFEVRSSPRSQRYQVLDALVRLFCRSDVSAEVLWDGGWLLRQLLPYREADVNRQHLKLLREMFSSCSYRVLQEGKGVWPDVLLTVLSDEWKKSKKAFEASSPRRELKDILLPSKKSLFGDVIPSESSFAAGDKMRELVKVFVLLCQLQMFFYGKSLPDQPPFSEPSLIMPENSRAKSVGLVDVGPKPGMEVKLVDAIPCRIAFERGKERHFRFLALSMGTSGWLVLVEALPLERELGVVRVVAPLAGCNPRVDDKHPRWLHLRIRPSSFPSVESLTSMALRRGKSKSMVDGRWTLAFRDEESCQSALSMILEEINLPSLEVERRLKPLLDLGSTSDKAEGEASSLN